MSRHLFKRLFHSVFTKLLVIILSAGFVITITLVVGFSVIRFQSMGHFDRNLVLYGEYLTRDLGNPPDYRQAEQIARRTGMAIRFDHPGNGWQTSTFPLSLQLDRAHVRRYQDGIWTGYLRGYAFLRIRHAGGDLIFISPRWAEDRHNAWKVFLAMAAAFFVILAAAYLLIRRVLRPLQPLKAGVEALGAGRLDHRVPQTGYDEFRDLSEAFNTMAKRLAALLANKEQLLLDVSHELRSPLTRLKVQVELIRDDAVRQSLKADVAEMEAMVSTILEEARLRSAAATLKLESTDMAQLVRSLLNDYIDRPPGVVSGSLDPAPIPLDRDKIRMVLRNLIENALKNTPADKPPVRVELLRGQGRLELVVEDQGVGIAESALPRLFEPFFRTDGSRSRKTGGFGLGLSLVKAIVDAHHGTIEISSSPGKGTRVLVALPIP